MFAVVGALIISFVSLCYAFFTLHKILLLKREIQVTRTRMQALIVLWQESRSVVPRALHDDYRRSLLLTDEETPYDNSTSGSTTLYDDLLFDDLH